MDGMETMNHPVVSIITPSYNRADLVEETARSIFAQRYPHWEWVIVDDGSTDGSWEILEGFAATDERVRIFRRHRGPKGACACRNIAVEKSTGQYLIFLDTDDLLAEHCLEQRVAAMQQSPDMDFIIFPMLLFKQDRDDMNLLWNIDNGRDDIERILFGDAVCQGTGTLWKKDSFIRIGLWKEDLRLWQDVELHLRSMLEGMRHAKRFDLSPDIFLRVTEVSLSRTGFHSPEKLASRITVLRETGQRMIDKGLVERYQKGLRSMYLDIFFNAAGSRQSPAIRAMRTLDRTCDLFNEKERKWMQALVLLYRLRAYRVPGFAQWLNQRVRSIEARPDVTLNRIAYQPAKDYQQNTAS
jgi:glycosyltransferase involved in cell wall biosynthesis